MELIMNTKNIYKLIFGLAFALALNLIFATSTHAATINVAAGNDETTVNSNCSLSEAITNINNGDATTYPECTGTGVFGVEDTVNLPSGTIVLVDDLPQMQQPIIIQGQGMASSVLDGNEVYRVFSAEGSYVERIEITGLTIKDFSNHAIAINNANVVLSRIGVTGNLGVANQPHVVLLQNGLADQQLNATLTDISVHDLNIDASNIAHMIVIANKASDVTYDVSMNNVTVANIQNISGSINTVMLGSGMYGNAPDAVFNARVRNLTLDNIVAQGAVNGVILSAMALDDGGDNNIESYLDIANVTIRGIRIQPSVYGGGSIVSSVTAAMYSGSVTTASMEIANSLFVDNIYSAGPIGCGALDYGPLMGTPEGIATPSITSSGGNLSDDNSCSADFTNLADQNNLVNLASTLGALSDNGGFVPTIPLLEGSPAIDAGVDVTGLTTDARGVARPQGLAYDSGAYESPSTRASANSSQNNSTNQLAATGQNTLLPILTAVSLLSISSLTALSFAKR